MAKSCLLLVLLFLASCNSSTELKKDPFQFELDLMQIQEDLYHLIAIVDLEEQDYLISPFSTDSIYGSLSLSLNGERITYSRATLIETPKSKEEYDPIIKDTVRRITQKTTFQYKVKLDKKATEIKGLFQFVLEPICIPYEVRFDIKNLAEKSQIIKTSTKISKDYKGGNKPSAPNIFKTSFY